MSIQDNINIIESDIATFFEGLKQVAVTPIQTAVAAGGTSLSADAEAVVGVAAAVSAAVAKVPGMVGTVATTIEGVLPFAQQMIAFFEGLKTPAATVAPPGTAKS